MKLASPDPARVLGSTATTTPVVVTGTPALGGNVSSAGAWLRPSAISLPNWGGQRLLVCIDDEDGQKLGRLRLARIGADGVTVAGQLGPALSCGVDRNRPVVDLAANRPLEHGRVDEGVRVRVGRRVPAWAVLDDDALDALAGNVRQLVLVDDSYLDVLVLRRFGKGATELQGRDKN